ncbi:MAG: sugar phosphate nucleotidyltransferase [bacterium]|nr:sugar phosphate nucleotidyltransferase [bacterium]
MKMNCTLVIMAAGMGSRFGGIKQLEPVGPSGEIIMDYSVFAAKKAGFTKVVFIIRRDIEEAFKEAIGNRLAEQIEVEYVFQDMDAIPEGYEVPAGRTKPWGTGQAILAIKDTVKEPFAVINADDYYGEEGFKKIAEFLSTAKNTDGKYNICMVGFELGNTLSDNGSVTRGVCEVNEANELVDICETSGIEKVDGVIKSDIEGQKLTDKTPVSMNMWGFTPEFINELDARFAAFLDGIKGNELKAEYLLPSIVGDLIQENKAEVTVLTSSDKWFGVTYKEDKQVVVDSFAKLVEEGVYPKKLF